MAINSYLSTSIYCLMLFGTGWQNVYAGNFTNVQKLLDLGQYNKAWKQLQATKHGNEGSSQFDYLYGIAAFETGHYDQAIFALDRVTVISPNDVNARIYLARTYRKLNNNQAALKQEHELQKISGFKRKAKQKTKSSLKSKINATAVLSAGYSDNSNFGSDDNQLDSPTLGVIELRPSAKRKKSSFSEARFKINFQKPLSSDFIWFSSARLSNRKFNADSESDFSIAKLQTGALLNKGKQQYSVKLHAQPKYLNKEYFSSNVGIATNFAYQLDKKQKIETSLIQEKYSDKKHGRQSKKRISILGNYIVNQKKTKYQGSLFIAKETPESDAEAQYARNLAKVGYKVSHRWNPKNLSFANISHQIADHQGVNPLYGQKRKDNSSTLNLGHEYNISNKTITYINIEYANNKSNLDLYDTNRKQISAGVAFQF